MNLFLFYLGKQRDQRDIAFSNIYGKLFIYRLSNRWPKIHPWRRPFEYEIEFCFLDSDGPVKLL